MSLPEALERAATALAGDADEIRPANGDPGQLLGLLDTAAASRVLGWMLGNEPEASEELAASWADDPRGHAALASIAEADLPKSGRKVLRRVVHRLRSSGVELEAPAPDEPKVARLPDLDDDIEMAFVSALDPRGSQLVYLVESNPSGGARMFEIIVDPRRGVAEFEVYSAGRSKVRGFVKSLRQRSRLSACEVEPAAARALLARVADAHPPDRAMPKAFGEWRHRLTEAAGKATPGELAAEALGADASPAALRSVADLVRGGALGPWAPGRAELAAIAERFKEGSESPLILSGSQKQDRIETAVEESAAEVFDADFTEATARRLCESAYVLWKLGKDDDARACLGAAQALRESPPAENPVAKAMLEVALAPVLSELLSESPEEESEEASGDDEAPLLVEP